MVQGQTGRRQLSDSHHVARHCRPRDVGATREPIDTAFRLRPGEECRSTNWMEYFHDSDRQVQIVAVRRALTDKGFQVRRSASFAVLNVGAAVAVCSNRQNVEIQFVALGEPHDPSHAGIYGYTEHNVAVAALLATLVAPNEIYPAAN